MLSSTYFSDPLSLDPNAHSKISCNTFKNGYHLHWHSFFELEFVISGSCMHILNGCPQKFKKGDICFLNPASIHQFIPNGDEPATIFTLSFDASVLPVEFWACIPANNLPISTHLEGEAFVAVKHCFEMLFECSSPQSLPINIFTLRGIEWLLSSVFGTMQKEKQADISKIQPAIVFIQSNFQKPITLRDVANVVNYSPEYFSEVFHREIHITFQVYLLELRLLYATILLHIPDLSISEICQMSGFRTPQYFSNAFKTYHGSSPQKFRREGLFPVFSHHNVKSETSAP